MPEILSTTTLKRSRKFTSRTLCGVVAGVGLLVFFWYVIHALQDLVHYHPAAVLLFPFTGMFFLANFLPIGVFLAFEREFGELNPLLPHHYLKILVRSYTALLNNSWKVEGKDL